MASLKLSHLVIGKKDRVMLSHPTVKEAIAKSPMTVTFHSRVEPHGRVAFGTAALECAYGLRVEGNLDKRDATFTSFDIKRSSTWKRARTIQNRGPPFDANATTCLKYVSDSLLEEVKRITDVVRPNSWSGLALLFGLIAGALNLSDSTVYELVARILARIERGEEAAVIFWKTVNDRKAIHDEVRRAGSVSTNKGGSPVTRAASCNSATAALQSEVAMTALKAENAALRKEFAAFKLGSLEVAANAQAALEHETQEEAGGEDEEEEEEEAEEEMMELPDPMVELAAELEAALAEEDRAEEHAQQEAVQRARELAPNSPYWQDHVNYEELLNAEDMDLAAELEAAVHARGELQAHADGPFLLMDLDTEDDFDLDLSDPMNF